MVWLLNKTWRGVKTKMVELPLLHGGVAGMRKQSRRRVELGFHQNPFPAKC